MQIQQYSIVAILVDLHLMVNCGMQIQQYSIVTKVGGFGQYANQDKKASPSNVTSFFMGSADGKGHAQMCIITKEVRDDEDVRGMPSGIEVVVTAPIDVPSNIDLKQIKAYGVTEVHLYSNNAIL